jgi:hypothetical protein
MKPHFSDLTKEQQATFGNGCTLVPDFIFTADCRHHDFNYSRGGWLRHKLQADWDMCCLMWGDSFLWWHYAITVIYWLGLTLLPFPYFFFTWGRWRTVKEIIERDMMSKINSHYE